jgi:hypothetical protein
MKKVVFISSGQDGLYCLYKALSETTDDVHAINIHQQYNYSKAEIEYTKYYMDNCVEWLQQNVRDFEYSIVPEIEINWSSHTPWKSRRYDGLSEKSIALIKIGNFKYKGDLVAIQNWERDYNIGYYGKLYNADEIISGLDYLQSQNRTRLDGSCTIAQIEFGMEFSYPIAENMVGRISVYAALPDGLRDIMIQCANRWKGEEKNCEQCRKCLTREAYDRVIQTGILTVKELDGIIHNYVINHSMYQTASATKLVQERISIFLKDILLV